MTQFSSGKHDKLTADPWPIQGYWPDGGKGGRYAYPFTFQDVREFRREPRPEFDRPLNNPANPILAELRRVIGLGAEPRGQYQVFLNGLVETGTPNGIDQIIANAIGPNPEGYGHVLAWNWDWEQRPKIEGWRYHARKVLTRLTRLNGENDE